MRRERAARDVSESFLLREAGENLAERLGAVKRNFCKALDLGSRVGSFVFLAPHAGEWLRTNLWSGDHSASVIADEEALPFAAQTFNLVVSVFGLHAVNDLPGALVQIRRLLTPDGLFLAALFGGATLGELRRAFAGAELEMTGGASPRIAPFSEVRDMGALLQRAGFAMPVADLERVSVRYGSFATLAGDLRVIGETNALAQRRRAPLRRDVLSAALDHYAAHDADADGRLGATFDILYLTGWAQQQGVMRLEGL